MMEQIHQQIEQEQSGASSIIKPVFLSICDGLVGIKKLGLKEKGITASRLVSEVEQFDYHEESKVEQDHRLDKENLNASTQANRDDKGAYERSGLEDKTALSAHKQERYSGSSQTHSELEVNEKGQQRRLHRANSKRVEELRSADKKTSRYISNTDHNLPLKYLFDEYGASKALTKEDIKRVANLDTNYDEISAQLNTQKGAKTWTEFSADVEVKRAELLSKQNKGKLSKKQQQELADLPTKQTLENAKRREKVARKASDAEANKAVLGNLTKDSKLAKGVLGSATEQGKKELENRGIGEVVLLIIKPIMFEFKDIFTNGIESGTDSHSALSSLKYRLNRAFDYVKRNVAAMGFDVIKDALLNFCRNIVNAIVDMFVGVLKKGLKIVMEGFSAIMQSIKILCSDSSPAQKGDAITKLLATTITTYVGYSFEETILGFVSKMPMGDILSEAMMVVVTGISSSVVVWLLDQLDLFSTKLERRTQRVKEVFDLRVRQIKENTDAFETTSLEQIAKQRLAQRKLAQDMSDAIEQGSDLNRPVLNMADWLKIDLKVRTTDDFIKLLESDAPLAVN
ncbi:DNA repair protein [Idiomarina sp. MD25a]|uniref:DNA repair protein n=1 Tax=Idiomarina sp. MD25a TaxID=1889913 RepID=UPI00117BC44F|nr:DNA repair protein [Idiomarina sp. MD25a]